MFWICILVKLCRLLCKFSTSMQNFCSQVQVDLFVYRSCNFHRTYLHLRYGHVFNHLIVWLNIWWPNCHPRRGSCSSGRGNAEVFFFWLWLGKKRRWSSSAFSPPPNFTVSSTFHPSNKRTSRGGCRKTWERLCSLCRRRRRIKCSWPDARAALSSAAPTTAFFLILLSTLGCPWPSSSAAAISPKRQALLTHLNWPQRCCFCLAWPELAVQKPRSEWKALLDRRQPAAGRDRSMLLLCYAFFEAHGCQLSPQVQPQRWYFNCSSSSFFLNLNFPHHNHV